MTRRGSEVGEKQMKPTKAKEEEEEEKKAPEKLPTWEEFRAAREHLDAMYVEVVRFTEETIREVEEDRKAGRVPDPAEIDMDLWKKRYAKIVRDYPPPEHIVPAEVAAAYLKLLDDED
ncbi:hypothetical protein U9M48_033234 [Paspalum notatum var. saurae]|uniref:Uncharacterized protein n=1 Tax=Paspalum notatum var. saurae TaxID=547442 RepID=A0AAQ3U6Y5_PASNO